MKNVLSLVLAAGLLLFPFAAYATDYGSQPPQNQQVPPVAQPLLREGDFAIKLAAQLNLGSPTDEATAEDMLAKAGVVPANGWISDYPVTPEIIGQLNDSIAGAADAGKLPMGADEAKKELAKLAGQMDLPMPAGPGTEATPGQPSLSSQTPTVNNYYYQQGPPVITYYPPPTAYFYLYDWVPYPAIWFGFWFPGFYICHDFTTVVVRPPIHGPHHFERAIVTDRFIDPATRRVARVDHEFRTESGRIRPQTMLRTESGRTFSSVTQFRNAAGPGTRTFHDRSMAPQTTAPTARENENRLRSETRRNGTLADNDTVRSQNRRNAPARAPQRSFDRAPMNKAPGTMPGINRPPSPGVSPSTQQRAFNPPTSSMPNQGTQRSFSAPRTNPGGVPSIGRVPSSPPGGATRSPGPMRSFSGGGSRGAAAGGFSRGGGGVRR